MVDDITDLRRRAGLLEARTILPAQLEQIIAKFKTGAEINIVFASTMHRLLDDAIAAHNGEVPQKAWEKHADELARERTTKGSPQYDELMRTLVNPNNPNKPPRKNI